MSRAAGVALSYPLLGVETGKSIQEKMKGIKPTESASFPPASEPAGEEKTLDGPWESPLFRGRVLLAEAARGRLGASSDTMEHDSPG